MAAESDDAQVDIDQNLKAAVHYTVGQICTTLAEDSELTFSKHVIAVISETIFKQSGTFAADLEMFSQHAKRKMVNADDVKLLARRSGTLAHHISSFHKRIQDREDTGKKKSTKKT